MRERNLERRVTTRKHDLGLAGQRQGELLSLREEAI